MLEIEFSDSGGLQGIIDHYRGVAERLRDLSWLAEAVRVILRERVTAALESGVDREGHGVAAIKESTARRRARAGRGTGPARVPDDASRFLTGMRTEVVAIDGGYRVRLSWEGVPFLKYHIQGTVHMVARDPVGLDEDGVQAIRDAVDRAVREAFAAA